MEHYKIKLKSGKIVVVRQPLIKDQENAAIAASPRANGDQNVLQILMQAEIMKLLIVSINGKEIKGVDREQLDKLLNFQEYAQLQMAVGKVTGDMKELGEYQLEVLTSGET